MMSYEFVIPEVSGGNCEFALDDIYWEGGITSLSENPDPVNPEGFGLEVNYPNPFKTSTTISYQLPESEDLVLTVVDVTGRAIKKLVNTHQTAGTHLVTWSVTNEQPGIYFYQLKTGEFVETKKCWIQ
jgi:hypothetical protein